MPDTNNRNTIDTAAFLDLDPDGQRLILAARGWYLFPLTPWGKRPLPGSRGLNDSTTDLDTILSWPKDCGIGIDCGRSGLVVLDADNHTDERPPTEWDYPGVRTGEDVLALLWTAHGEPGTSPWADALTVITPSGGTHLYLAAPAGDHPVKSTAGKLGWQVDTRARGGYVVAPGTELDGEDGCGVYRPLHWPKTLPTCPLWIPELLNPPPRPRTVFSGAPSAAGGSMFAPAEGMSRKALAGILKAVADAPAGKRNEVLNWGAWKLAEGDAATDENLELLRLAADAAGLEPDEIQKTIASAVARKAR